MFKTDRWICEQKIPLNFYRGAILRGTSSTTQRNNSGRQNYLYYIQVNKNDLRRAVVRDRARTP